MNNWITPSTPETMPHHPWLHAFVIEFLERLLQPTWHVLEHGAGGSTLWLAERVEQVVSIESQPEWYERVRSLAPANVDLRLWNEARLPDLEHRLFDLVLIDGEPTINRALYLRAAKRLVKPGGWLILDNCNRVEYPTERAEMQKLAQHYVTFMSHPGMFANTEFYHMRTA